MAGKIKRIQGLKNIHVAKMTENTPKYATPVAVPGAKEISLELSYEEVKMYADDAIDYMDYIFAGGSGTLSLTGLAASEYELLFGSTKEEGGAVVKSTDVAPELALLFENDKLGVQGKRLYAVYAVKFAPPSITSKTKEGTVEDEPIELSFTVRELSDGRIFKFVDTDEPGGTDKESTWYTQVAGAAQAQEDTDGDE